MGRKVSKGEGTREDDERVKRRITCFHIYSLDFKSACEKHISHEIKTTYRKEGDHEDEERDT